MNLMSRSRALITALLLAQVPVLLAGQTQKPAVDNKAKPISPASPVTLPSNYVIGVEDVLDVVFWRDKELSAQVVVRPDGKISLPMLNDVMAAGMTPEGLADVIAKAATKFVRDPGATVMVKEIRSRKVYIIGEVGKPGTFQLVSEMTVLQAIGEAGGFIEGADKGDVIIVRKESGKELRFRFNYNDVIKGKNPAQNIRLIPGDTIIVH